MEWKSENYRLSGINDTEKWENTDFQELAFSSYKDMDIIFASLFNNVSGKIIFS